MKEKFSLSIFIIGIAAIKQIFYHNFFLISQIYKIMKIMKNYEDQWCFDTEN